MPHSKHGLGLVHCTCQRPPHIAFWARTSNTSTLDDLEELEARHNLVLNDKGNANGVLNTLLDGD